MKKGIYFLYFLELDKRVNIFYIFLELDEKGIYFLYFLELDEKGWNNFSTKGKNCRRKTK